MARTKFTSRSFMKSYCSRSRSAGGASELQAEQFPQMLSPLLRLFAESVQKSVFPAKNQERESLASWTSFSDSFRGTPRSNPMHAIRLGRVRPGRPSADFNGPGPRCYSFRMFKLYGVDR